MAKYSFGYRCPECAGKFSWSRDAEPPARCPLCNAWVSEDEPEEFVPKAPAIHKSVYAKSIDQTYRQMEAASIERADEAESILSSEYAAQPRDEFDGLVKATQREELQKLKSEIKMTNMKDPSQMRAGDTAQIAAPASVPASMTGASYQPPPGGFSGSGAEFAKTISRLTSNHTPRAVSMIRAGQMGKY